MKTKTKSLTLIELVTLASEGYETAFPDCPLTEQCQPDGTPLSAKEYEKASIGDTLGRFIVIELADTFDPKASRTEQVKEAFRVIHRAKDDLKQVCDALKKKR